MDREDGAHFVAMGFEHDRFFQQRGRIAEQAPGFPLQQRHFFGREDFIHD